MHPENEKQARILACWRVRAAAAGLSVGAATYALGAGAAIELCLNAAWLSALAVLPACYLLAAFSRRMLVRARQGRVLCLLLAAALGGCAAFAYGALVSLIRETLLPLARVSFIAQITAVFLLLCCLPGQRGALRLSFALRRTLPALLLLLAGKAIWQGRAAGLFPLLGTGAVQTGMAAAAMLPAALPALMLALPPPELEGQTQDVPKTGFFVRRLLTGAGAAIVLLVLLSLCNPYEGIAAQRSWGERMIILSSGAPREGIAGTILTLLQAASLALLAINTLLCAVQAAKRLLRKEKDA